MRIMRIMDIRFSWREDSGRRSSAEVAPEHPTSHLSQTSVSDFGFKEDLIDHKIAVYTLLIAMSI